MGRDDYCFKDWKLCESVSIVRTRSIDLVSFTGKCENNTSVMEFVVASQINNDYYTIERSVDGYEWTEVGIIGGEGNTSTQMTYRWIDDQ